jgi:hypothetical protein
MSLGSFSHFFNSDYQLSRANWTVTERRKNLRFQSPDLISKLAGDLGRADKQLASLDLDLSALTDC